jgi:parallel beta-helix repeat protein
MPDPNLQFDPVDGHNNTEEFLTNPPKEAVRGYMQRLHDQTRDFINGAFLTWIKATFTTKTGDHAGTWQGLSPTQAEPGLSAKVDAHLADYSKQIITMSKYADGDGTDETTAIQQAITDSVGKTLIWTKQQGTHYETLPLTIPSNTHIIFEPGTLVKAKTGYGLNDQLLNITSASNVIIEGNYATLQMLKAEYTEGEQRHGIFIIGSENVKIEDLIVKDTGGDAFLIGADEWTNFVVSKNIKLIGCTGDNSRRNGISVVGAEDVLIDNCTVINTIGTEPQAGIDIEPNNATYSNKNVEVKNCTLKDNVLGILVYNNSYDVVVCDNKLYNSGAISVKRLLDTDPYPTAKVERNIVEDSDVSGISLDSCKGITVEGNTVNNSTGVGIIVTTLFSQSEKNKVLNNKVTATGGIGILIDASPYCDVKDNVIEATAAEAIKTSGSNYAKIVDNQLFDCSTALKDAITITTSDYSEIRENKIRRVSKNTRYGISIDINSDDVLIEDNDLYDCAITKDISTASTSTIISTNTFLDGKKSVYTVTDFLPTATRHWCGRLVILKKAGEIARTYTAVEKPDGTFGFERIESKNRLSAAPTTGTWAVGDMVYNSTPTAGSYLGWVCITAGTPGTWKGFGLIQA